MNRGYGRLQIIDSQLWHVGDDEIDIYRTDLKKVRTIKLSGIIVQDLAEMNGDMVSVASFTGLFLIDMQGKKYH